MRSLRLSVLMLLALFMSLPAAQAVVTTVKPAETTVVEKEMTRQEKREMRKEERKARKEARKAVKAQIKEWRKNAEVSDNLVLLVILAILFPPLAMGIYEGGLTSRFWISLLLTLLFYIPGLVYTLIVILGEN